VPKAGWKSETTTDGGEILGEPLEAADELDALEIEERRLAAEVRIADVHVVLGDILDECGKRPKPLARGSQPEVVGREHLLMPAGHEAIPGVADEREV
jgi:hypothetical protein